jgi:dTDP-4-dehydrorhamnose 3,5-epimerase
MEKELPDDPMKFIETPLPGAFVIELEERGDDRGFFARAFCQREFQQHGLNPNIVQMNISLSARRGTLRGIHYQLAPKAEDKTFRCLRGAFFDVVVDLRPESPTFLRHFTVELTGGNRKMVHVPQGCANSFLTLEDDTELFYFTSEFYAPEWERGIRYNDPKLGIQWPMEPAVISDKDKNHPDFKLETHLK